MPARRIIAISNHGTMLGGGEYSFLDLLSHLPDWWKPIAVVPHKGTLEQKLLELAIPTHTAPLPPIRPWRIHSFALAIKSYVSLCLQTRPLLLYANGPRAVLYGGIAARLLRIPVIWHCRISDPDPHLDFILSRLSNRIIANSEATAKRFNSGLSNKLQVVYNGMNLEWLKENHVGKPAMVEEVWKVILVIARVSRWKRHDLALRSFEAIAHLEPKAHLVCMGAKDDLDPGWWDHLQIMTLQSPFSERIHWIGQVEDIRPWLKSASLLLLTSHNEPFGRVLVEALACGVPVIATRSGGVPEIVREGLDGLLVSPGNVHETSGCMLKLLGDESLKNRLSESGRKRAEEFSLESHVRQMVRVFEETSKHPIRHSRP